MTSPAGEASAKAVRQQRARRLVIRFALWVGLPTIVSIFYYGCVVTEQYESVAIVTVQSNERSVSGLEALAGGGRSRDAQLIRDYVESRAMSKLLVERHGFAEHYQSSDVDWFSRLDDDDGVEKTHDHYREMVTIVYRSQSGTLHLKVRAYSSEAAHRFAKVILQASEDKLRELFAQARQQPFLVTVAEPSLPDSPRYPRRAWSVATVFVVSLLLMGIIGLLAAAVREHAKF